MNLHHRDRFLLLVCTWRHSGHVGGQEQKPFSHLGTKPYFHVNSSRKNSIGHFRVPKPLNFKKRPSAQPFLWKWVLFAWEWKTIFLLTAKRLPSFSYRSPRELGNDLFTPLPNHRAECRDAITYSYSAKRRIWMRVGWENFTISSVALIKLSFLLSKSQILKTYAPLFEEWRTCNLRLKQP